MSRPDWLPDLVLVDGEWERVLSRLYAVFKQDFIEGRPRLHGMPVWWDKRILEGGEYEEGFWHLVTKTDHSTGERLLDNRRAERLAWLAPLLQNCHDPAVKIWHGRDQKRRKRIYVWLEALDYVAVFRPIEQRKTTVAFLVTAFHVSGSQSRERLEKDYDSGKPV